MVKGRQYNSVPKLMKIIKGLQFLLTPHWDHHKYIVIHSNNNNNNTMYREQTESGSIL